MKINEKRIIKYFCDMVSIDSESGSEAEFAKYLKNLAQNLGFRSTIDRFGNVYIIVGGKGKPLMLNTHMDTVSPGVGIKPIVKNGIIKSSGDTVLGADPKITIAAIFELLTLISENIINSKPLEITFTCNEESGMPTAGKIKTRVKECIVPDRGTPLGEIIIESPFAQVFDVAVKGKAAYATTDFEKGRHAILSAANSINNIRIGNFDEFSTANIGTISGGTVNTVIPEKCKFTGNCYSFKKRSLTNFVNQLDQVLAESDKKFGTVSKVKMQEYFGGFDISKNDRFVELVQNSINKSGIRPLIKKYMAVSNANILNNIGIKTILISNGVREQHTKKEHIYIKDLIKLTEIISNIIAV